MNKFEKIVVALLCVVAIELGCVVVMAARLMSNGVQIEVIQNDNENNG